MNQGFTWGLVLGRREGLETREALRTGLVCSALGTSPAAIVVTQRVAERRAEELAPPAPEPLPTWKQVRSRLCAELEAAKAIKDADQKALQEAKTNLGCNGETPTEEQDPQSSDEVTQTAGRSHRTRRS